MNNKENTKSQCAKSAKMWGYSLYNTRSITVSSRSRTKKMPSVFRKVAEFILLLSIVISQISGIESSRAATMDGNKITITKSDIRYKLKFEEDKPKAVQNFYVGKNDIYTTQRVREDGDGDGEVDNFVKLTYFKIKDKKPVKESEMWVRDAGHGQTLEVYEHEGKTYVLFAVCNNKEAENNKGNPLDWSLEIARLEYEANTKENPQKFDKLKRFSGIEYANASRKAFGTIWRTDAAVSADNKTIILWKRNKADNDQVTGYDFKRFNDILDGDICGKWTSFNFKNITKEQAKFKFCYTINKGDDEYVSSIQGIEVSNKGDNGKHSIYIASGDEGNNIKNTIYRYNSDGNLKSKKVIVRNKDKLFPKPMEIEGIHIDGGKLNFLLVESSFKNRVKIKDADKSIQNIMTIDKDFLK